MERAKRLISTLLLAIITTSFLAAFSPVTVQATTASTKFWALLVVCGNGPNDYGIYASGDYMYHVISEHLEFDGIYYLNYDTDTYPGVNATVTVNNTRSAITDWLYNTSGPNDTIFMYFATHGGGHYNNYAYDPFWPYDQNFDARSDDNGDEGSGDNYDEHLGFYGDYGSEYYYDDDLAADIDSLSGNYSKLVFATQSCFGGGLIHDIQSKPRNDSRVILTATNYQLTAYLDLDRFKDPPEDDGYAEYSEGFIDALHGEDTYWNESQLAVVHQNVTVDADRNHDGHVSIEEADRYARGHDDGRNEAFLDEIRPDPRNDSYPFYPIAYYSVPEIPQIDNLLLASEIWFPRKGERLITVQASLTDDTELVGVEFWIDNGTTTFTTPEIVNVTVGNHTIEMQDSFVDGNYEYVFKYWNYDNSSNNPLTVNVLEHTILTAYYDKIFLGNGHYLGNVNHPGSYFHWTYIELGYGIDLQVNQTDLYLIDLAYGKFAWDPWGVGEDLYNPDANINGDEIVDAKDIWIVNHNLGTSFEEYWDGYKYEKKNSDETIYFYNTTNFEEDPLGQEKYEDGEKVFDDYYIADWDPVWAFQIANSTQGQRYFEEGWFCFDP